MSDETTALLLKGFALLKKRLDALESQAPTIGTGLPSDSVRCDESVGVFYLRRATPETFTLNDLRIRAAEPSDVDLDLGSFVFEAFDGLQWVRSFAT